MPDFDADFPHLTGHDPFPWQRESLESPWPDRPERFTDTREYTARFGKTTVFSQPPIVRNESE